MKSGIWPGSSSTFLRIDPVSVPLTMREDERPLSTPFQSVYGTDQGVQLPGGVVLSGDTIRTCPEDGRHFVWSTDACAFLYPCRHRSTGYWIDMDVYPKIDEHPWCESQPTIKNLEYIDETRVDP